MQAHFVFSEAFPKKIFLQFLGILAVSFFTGLAEAKKINPIQEIFEPPQPEPAHQYSKVAVVQWAPGSAPLNVSKVEAEEFKQSNRETLEAYIREAVDHGAEWVVTPEFAVVGYPDLPGVPDEDDEFQTREQLAPYVETIPGPTTKYFGALALELGVFLQVGFAEEDRRTGHYHNTVVAFDPSGSIVGIYRKINLYKGEKKILKAGEELSIYKTPWGRVGMIICADVYSPFPLEDYYQEGVDILALSTSWAQANTGMTHFRRAARDMGVSLLAANQSYFPDSGVINSDGSLQSHIRQSVGIAYGYLKKRKNSSGPRR